jgi:PAS domain S-box-containing protein
MNGQSRAIPDFQEMLEAIPDAVVAVSSAGTITMANAHAADMFGYAHEDLDGYMSKPIEPATFIAELAPFLPPPAPGEG